jgi:hypothetical protein
MPRKKEPSAPPGKRPIERYEHTDKKRVAVKVIDDRGIESLKIVNVK